MEATGSPNYGIVYVLTNPAMPGLVKIGFTTKSDVNARLNELYTTGVPLPFKLEMACRVDNASEVEKALHTAFGPNRANPRREFFEIASEQAIAILKVLKASDVTSEVTVTFSQGDAVDQGAAKSFVKRNRRPNLNFHQMGIPNGSELVFTEDSNVSAIVVSERTVRLKSEEDGSEFYLSPLTAKLLGLEAPSRNSLRYRVWSWRVVG